MKIAIAIATTGRRDGLSQTVAFLHNQTFPAAALYICPASVDDLDVTCLDGFPCKTKVVKGERGSAHQRNAILRNLEDEDIVLFLDDDFLPEPTFFAELSALFERHRDLVIATGDVAADGATTQGIAYDEAMAVLNALPPLPPEQLEPRFNGYGCNMAVKADVLRQTRVEFDENLPLYAWWEDVDFSRRIASHGRIVQSNRLRGVHQGSKKGKSPGKRLGYSQVANLLYMARKGTISNPRAFKQISKNMVANVMRSLWPEPWVDRKGRVAGNLLAIGDALRGKVNPNEILKFK